MAWRDQDATNLAVSYDRVDMRPSPLLVIGLGGTGCDMLRTVKRTFAERFRDNPGRLPMRNRRTVKRTFAERFRLPKDNEGHTIPVPERTAYLAIDSDDISLKDFETGEYPRITTTNVASILRDHEHLMTPEECTWMHRKMVPISPGSSGTYRNVARLILSRNYEGVRNAIYDALRRITSVNASHEMWRGNVEIVILTSIGGGTGSGTFLDIPQIVRHIMETDATLSGKPYKITGYLVMPDATLSHVQNESMGARIRANGYAALKELDFWMGYDTHRTHYTMTYGDGTRINWVRPYDDCVLLSGTDVNGKPVPNPYETIQTLVAEELLHSFAVHRTADDGDAWWCPRISVTHARGIMLCSLSMPMPLNYCYCAIGAYTLAVPKKKLIFYEGSLLFNTFMPPRDQNGNLVPNDDLLKDGQTHARVASMTGSIGDLYNQFAVDNPYPAVFAGLDAHNRTQMNNLRTMQPAPHDDYRQPPQWAETVLEPAAHKAAADYLDMAWDNFQRFCSYVMSNPAQGPYSLLLYLTDEGPTAFMPALRTVEQEWENYANNLHNDIVPRYDACFSTYKAFMWPPLLGRIRAVQNYLDNLQALLNAVRLDCFMREYNKKMKLFVKRVQEYVHTALKPLCDALERLSSEWIAGEKTADALHGDLFDIHQIMDMIDAEFAAQNRDNKVSRGFLERLCRQSLETTENADPYASGVKFVFGEDARTWIMVTMRDELNANLGNVNGRSLDALMVQAGNTDDSAQTAYIGGLGARALNNATPLFYQNDEAADTRCMEYSFLAVPNDAPLHVRRLMQTRDFNGVDIHESALRDHIYSTTVWDGLPLYRYGLLGEMEAAYEAVLMTDNGAGLHLVWSGDLDSPYTSNWTKLPNPKPYYLFHPKGGSARVRREYKDAHKIVDRALDAGLLTIDASREKPSYTFRAFYTDQTQRTLAHESVIASKVNALVSGGDSESGGKLRGEALRQALEALMAQAAEQKVEPQKKPTFMAGMLEIQDQPIDPFDRQAQDDPRMLAQARKNYEALCREFAVVMLLQQPELYARVCIQLPGFEAINAALEAIDR